MDQDPAVLGVAQTKAERCPKSYSADSVFLRGLEPPNLPFLFTPTYLVLRRQEAQALESAEFLGWKRKKSGGPYSCRRIGL